MKLTKTLAVEALFGLLGSTAMASNALAENMQVIMDGPKLVNSLAWKSMLVKPRTPAKVTVPTARMPAKAKGPARPMAANNLS